MSSWSLRWVVVAGIGGAFFAGCTGDDELPGGSATGGRFIQDGGGPGSGGSAGEAGGTGEGGQDLRADGGIGGFTDGQGGSGNVPTGSGGQGGMVQKLSLEGEACSGYTLIGSPENDAGWDFQALLVDMEGNVVHSWGITGFPPKMLSTGGLVGCTGVHPGTYDCIEMRQLSWTGELEWSFAGWESIGGVMGARHHHDYFRSNVNLGYYAPGADLSGQGSTFILGHHERELPEIRSGLIDDDVIYEVTDQGTLGDFVWYGADHFSEYGLDQVALNDVAQRNPGERLELLHGNSITPLGPNRWYDAGRGEFHPDNILYSSRQANFVAIIERATGNIVWRIGPDVAGRPEAGLGQFIGQHHPHVIPQGLPGAGNILLYDNGGAAGYGGTAVGLYRYERAYSRVIEFNPVTFEKVWEYGAPSGDEFFASRFLSNAQRLPNGNTLITVGIEGRVIEVTPGKKVVWQYQFVPPNPGGKRSWVYRAHRIPPEWVPAEVNEAGPNYATWASLFE